MWCGSAHRVRLHGHVRLVKSELGLELIVREGGKEVALLTPHAHHRRLALDRTPLAEQRVTRRAPQLVGARGVAQHPHAEASVPPACEGLIKGSVCKAHARLAAIAIQAAHHDTIVPAAVRRGIVDCHWIPLAKRCPGGGAR